MEHQKEFLRQTALFNAIGAAFQRAGIYTKDASPEAKAALRADLEKYLCSLERQFQRTVTFQEHFKYIDSLANDLSRTHARFLKERRFRVGVAQKALNIYLKLIWCYGWIPEPPHCPIDSVVLAEIGDTKTKWTKIRSIDAYRAAIEAICVYVRQQADGKSIAQWELEVWTTSKAKKGK